jgi:hypothetical protein
LLYVVVLIGVGVCVPYVRYVGALGDEGVLVHGAMRILAGDVLYRDFFGILPPGGYLIVTAWMKLFGSDLVGVRILAAGIIVGIAALVYATARSSSGSRPLAALIAVAWVMLSPGTWTVINHHWFTTAASMASAAGLFVVAGRGHCRAGAFAAGLFSGAAVMATSTRGALMCVAVIAVLLVLDTGRAGLVSATAGMLVIPTVMVAYMYAKGALGAAFDDVILFPALNYAAIQGVPFGMGASLYDLTVVVFFPAAFVLAGVALAQGPSALWRDPRFRVSVTLAVVGLLGSFLRPDLVHISFAVALACPLFALATVHIRGIGRIVTGAVFASLGFLGMVGAVTTAVIVGRQPMVATARGPIRAGPNLMADGFATLVREIDKVPRGDAFFFYPYSSLLPYLTGRRHAAALDVMIPGYTIAEDFRRTCVQVVTEAQWVVMDRQLSDATVLRKIYPAMRDPDPPEKREFEMVLREAFDDVVYTSGRYELRRRSRGGSAVPCERI